MQNFADLGLSEAALAAVERLGYENPTPVQLQAIPLVLEGRDLIAAASTGTGKTAAFLLPILSTLPRGKRGKRAPRVLVVSPTRELAQQISQTCMQITRKTGHYVTTVFGGTPYGPQINEIRRGTDVLIATPGRLNDLMNKGVVDLGGIKSLVLDEADRMLDMGFLPAVTTIVDAFVHEVVQAAGRGDAVSYTHLRAHETGRNLVCRLLLEKKKTHKIKKPERHKI